jgi:uncharacterized protein (TIGR03435 family)
LITVCPLNAQVVQSQSLAFEVASVKSGVLPAVPGGIRPVSAGGQFHAVLTLHDFIQVAYGAPLALLASQVVGGPEWVTKERFEITAKAEGIANAPSGGRDQLLAMMRTLLADRFRLQLRRESRQLPIFNLMLDRADATLGPRLRPEDGQCISISSAAASTADASRWCGFKRFGPGAISARGMTLEEFASGIATRSDIQRVVRNRTGLAGRFDVDLDYTPETEARSDLPPAGRTESGVGLFTALKEQLGLKLENATGPVDVLVIDHIERPTLD